jgi:hypothetical protein
MTVRKYKPWPSDTAFASCTSRAGPRLHADLIGDFLVLSILGTLRLFALSNHHTPAKAGL